MLKIVEVPQLQFLDKVVDVFFVQFIDGVDVPVIMQRRVLQSWTRSFTCPLRPTTGFLTRWSMSSSCSSLTV